MENKTNIDYVISSQGTVSGRSSGTFLANVFSWMFLALLISAAAALAFSLNPSLMAYLHDPLTGRFTGLGIVVAFAPLAFVLLMSFGYTRLAFPVLISLFLVYSAITGISLSFLVWQYTGSSVALTFGITAVTYGVMAVTGYRTQTDLTQFGTILRMAVIGLIVAMLANFFLHSSGLQYIISFAGVAIFTGLTAYDVQRLKVISQSADLGSNDDSRKLAVIGALKLYLDFINLFLFLLRLFGRRR